MDSGPWVWQTVKATAYGVTRKLRVVSFQAVWPEVRGLRPILVVLVRDPRGKFEDKYLFTTDLNADLGWVIAAFSRRWSIEVAFKSSKQVMKIQVAATLVSAEHGEVVALGVVDAERDRSVVLHRGSQTACSAGGASAFRRVGHGMVACSYAPHSPCGNPRSYN